MAAPSPGAGFSFPPPTPPAATSTELMSAVMAPPQQQQPNVSDAADRSKSKMPVLRSPEGIVWGVDELTSRRRPAEGLERAGIPSPGAEPCFSCFCFISLLRCCCYTLMPRRPSSAAAQQPHERSERALLVCAAAAPVFAS